MKTSRLHRYGIVARRRTSSGRSRRPIIERLEARRLLAMLGPSSERAYELLQQRMQATQGDFYVYRDADSAFNHGFPTKFFSDNAGDKVQLSLACVNDADSPTGCSSDPNVLDRERGQVMHVEFLPLGPTEFAGLVLNDPQEFLSGGQGYDLTGATHVVFEARTPTPGGVTVQFAVAEHPGSFTHLPQSDTFSEFSLSLASMGIDAGELASVQWLFSVSSNDLNMPLGGTILLDNIRFEPVPSDPLRVLNLPAPRLGLPLGNETFGTHAEVSSPFGPDQVLRNLATTYESSLTLLSLLDRGQPEDLAGARLIADTLVYALHHDLAEPVGLPAATDAVTAEVYRGLHDGYTAGDIPFLNDLPPGAESGQVKLAGFSVRSTACAPPAAPNQQPSFCLLQDGATSGNNAFAVMAFLAAYRHFEDPAYLTAARQVSRWIVETMKDDSGSGYGGYYFGFFEGGESPRVLRTNKSIENNADIFAAFSQLGAIERVLGNDADAELWQQHAVHAGDFVMEMYDPGDPAVIDDGHFFAGTVPLGTQPGPGVVASDQPDQLRGNDVVNRADFLDSHSFTTLALARSSRYRDQIDWREPVRYMLNTFAVLGGQGITANGVTFDGFSIVELPEPDQFRLGDPSPHGIAWEFTGQAVATMRFVDFLYGTSEFATQVAHYLGEIERAQLLAPFADGMGLVAATLDGEDEQNSPFTPRDHCLTTPFQCIPERVGLAATNWAIYAAQDVNIFAPQLPLPQRGGQEFVVDDWDFDVTRNDLGFNYFAGNTGATETVEGATTIGLSSVSQGTAGGSLDVAFDFAGQPSEVFAGYFASLFGLTDTLVSLGGSPDQPEEPTQFPGYYLDTQDVYRGLLPFTGRSVEQLAFDYQLISADDVTLKIELRDENGEDVFTRRTLSNPAAGWQAMSLAMPGDFDDSVSGAGDPTQFNWRQVSTFSLIVERNNVGAGVANPDDGRFLIDNLRLIDQDGLYPALDLIADPSSDGPWQFYEEAFLDLVRATSTQYFIDWSSTDPRTGGMIQDRSSFADLITTGGAGFQLTSLVVAAEREYLTRDEAARRVRDVLRVLHDQPQGPQPVGTAGNQGFFYHFLGIDGLRKQNFDFTETTEVDESLNTVELSTIDTALAVSGAVTAGQYFSGNVELEREIRQLADAIYARVNWQFMLDDHRFTNSNQFILGWKPNEMRDDASGKFGRFLLDDDPLQPTGQYASKPSGNNAEVPATIDFYTDEGLLIALLAMGSPNPDHRLGREVWDAMIRDSDGGSFIKTFPGALFTYEFASVWLDTEALGADNHLPINGQPARPTDFSANTRAAVLATRDDAIANAQDRVTWQAGGGATRWGLSAAEGPFDEYFALAAPSAALAQDGGFVAPAATLSFQAEDGSGDGLLKARSEAVGGTSVQLLAGESRILTVEVPYNANYTVLVRYSNDNFGPLESVEVLIDGVPLDSFTAQDTGNFGEGWNVFAESPLLGLIQLAPGTHQVTLSVAGGDGHGVEIDQVSLSHGDVLRPLEDGTTTVYGAGSAIKHAPEYAIPALWDAASLGLLHPRFGFADAFNLEIADAVVGQQPDGEILRTTGAWANLTGFSIDHGPMAIMIDNYLGDDFTPSLFMADPQIALALAQLFPTRQVLTLSLDDPLISENNGSTQATLVRWNADTSGELTVDLSATNAGEVAFPSTITIPAGEDSVTFVVTAVDDTRIDGTQTVSLSAEAAGFQPVTVLLEVLDHETWQNPINRFDVTNDGIVAPIDVLAVINDINARGPRPLGTPPLVDPPFLPPPFLDVNGDGSVAPSDVLSVVNFLNSQSPGSGEATQPTPVIRNVALQFEAVPTQRPTVLVEIDQGGQVALPPASRSWVPEVSSEVNTYLNPRWSADLSAELVARPPEHDLGRMRAAAVDLALDLIVGDWNLGDWDLGDWDLGDWDLGDWDLGDWHELWQVDFEAPF